MTEKNLVANHKPRAIATAIAAGGDKNAIPDTSTDTGVVNIDKGFPSDFSSPRAEGGKSVARKDMNGILNLLSQPEYFQQFMGRTVWDDGLAEQGYPKGAKVWHYDADGNSAEYVSKTDDNKEVPGVSTNWVKIGTANGLELDSSSIGSVIETKVTKDFIDKTLGYNISIVSGSIPTSPVSGTIYFII